MLAQVKPLNIAGFVSALWPTKLNLHTLVGVAQSYTMCGATNAKLKVQYLLIWSHADKSHLLSHLQNLLKLWCKDLVYSWSSDKFVQ